MHQIPTVHQKPQPIYLIQISKRQPLFKYRSIAGKPTTCERVVVAEMANPKVQVYGDVAILTYNYLGMNRDKDGETHANAAKSTRVYAKINGTWKLVHANFAPMTADDD